MLLKYGKILNILGKSFNQKTEQHSWLCSDPAADEEDDDPDEKESSCDLITRLIDRSIIEKSHFSRIFRARKK